MTAAGASAIPKTATATKTTYHVLKLSRAKTKPGDTMNATSASADRRAYDEYAVAAENVTANNSDHAIRVHAEKVAADGTTLDGSGVYVAIPSRSFKPTVVSVATTTTVKVGA